MRLFRERRLVARNAFDVQVTVFVGSRSIGGRAVDLSARGMGLLLDEAVALGSYVRVSFSLPGADGRQQRFDADGVVARVGARSIGLVFTAVDSRAVQRMNAILDAYRRALAHRKQAELYARRFARAPEPEPAPGPGLSGGPPAAPVTGEFGAAQSEEPTAAMGSQGVASRGAMRSAGRGSSGSSSELARLYREALQDLAGEPKAK